MHEQARHFGELLIALWTHEAIYLIRITEYVCKRPHALTLKQGFTDALMDDEFGPLKAHGRRLGEVVDVDLGWTCSWFEMNDHPAVGSELSWATATREYWFSMC